MAIEQQMTPFAHDKRAAFARLASLRARVKTQAAAADARDEDLTIEEAIRRLRILEQRALARSGGKRNSQGSST